MKKQVPFLWNEIPGVSDHFNIVKRLKYFLARACIYIKFTIQNSHIWSDVLRVDQNDGKF